MELYSSRNWRVLLQRGCRSGSHVLFLVWRCFPIANTGHQLNEEIRDKEVRLISDSGEQLGIMTSQEALHKAEEQGLDYAHVVALSLRPEEEELYTASGTPVAHLTVSENVLKSKEGIYLAL